MHTFFITISQMRKTSPERLRNSPNITQPLSSYATKPGSRTQQFPFRADSVAQIQKAAKAAFSPPRSRL